MKLLTDRLPKANYSSNQQSSGEGPQYSSHEKQLSEIPSQKSLNKDSSGTTTKTRSRKPLPAAALDSEQESTTRSDNSRSVSERNLKRNASENLKPLRGSGISDSSVDLIVGGNSLALADNRLRDKNSHDYLETIRENE